MLGRVATTSAPRSPLPECLVLGPGGVEWSREGGVVGLIVETDMTKLDDFEHNTVPERSELVKEAALGVHDRLNGVGDVLRTPSHGFPCTRKCEDRAPVAVGAAGHVELVAAKQPAGVEHLVGEQAPVISRRHDPIASARPGPHPVAHQQLGRHRGSTSRAGIVGDEFPAVAGAVLDDPPTDLTGAVVLVGMPVPYA